MKRRYEVTVSARVEYTVIVFSDSAADARIEAEEAVEDGVCEPDWVGDTEAYKVELKEIP